MNDANLLHAILSSATDYAIVTMDNAGVIVGWSAGAERIMGYREAEIIGKNGRILFTSEDQAKGVPEKEREIARTMGRAADNRWHVREDGSRFWGEGMMTPIYDGSGRAIGFLKILRDYTERKRTESEIFRLAHVDSITGLPNRSYFETRLAEMIAAAQRADQLLIVQLIELGDLARVNESLGHHVGDLLLHQAAQRVRSVLRETDFVARLGGDRIVVLQPNARNAQMGEVLATKLLDALSWPLYIEGREVPVRACIGIAVCPKDACDMESVLVKASEALHRVKQRSPEGGFGYVTDELDRGAQQRGRLLAELRRAVRKRSFRLVYQPTVATADGRVTSAEALLRCDDPTLARVPVTDVVRLGIEHGLMADIGAWVLSEACMQVARWRDAGLPRIAVSVNVHVHELLHPRFVDVVDAALRYAGIAPADLVLEIAEPRTADERRLLSVLRTLRGRGISVTLDDFGAVSSSFGSLQYLPVNGIKLDRAVVRELPNDRKSNAIAGALIRMAHTLDLRVTAEGVESQAQADFCRREGCDALQGFFIGAPMMAQDFADLLAHGPTAPLPS